AKVPTLDLSRCVINFKGNSIATARLRSKSAQDRGRVINVDRLAQTLAGQSLAHRIIRSIRRDNLDDVTPVGQRCAVDGIKVIAQLISQQPKRSFFLWSVIDRVFQRVPVSILSLPLKRARPALKNAPRGNYSNRAKQRRIKARRL